MSYPPSGYDDEAIIPRKQIVTLLDQVTDELGKIQEVFSEHHPKEISSPEIETQFWYIQRSAEELGIEFSFLVEKLISDYEFFRDEPNKEKLEQLFSDVKNLQHLLVG